MSAPLGIVHGYGFSGAGSNLWTRAIVRALCQLGHRVHVVCQESRPEAYDFVGEAYRYDEQGHPIELFTRETPYPGLCTVHRPDLAVLPAYVRPRTASTYVRYIPDLDDDTLEYYIAHHARILSYVAAAHGVVAFHVNHVVLSSVALQRVKEKMGVPYAVLPHGSAIEYVVKKDLRMRAAARGALSGADRVFALNGEMEHRLQDVFTDVPGLMEKVQRLPVGVDTAQFDSATPEERPERIRRLLDLIADLPRGRTAEQQETLRARLHGDLEDDELRTVLTEGADYTSSAPDADLEDRLGAVDWVNARVVAYVGRLIAAKGAPMVVAAFPEILARVPEARLIIGGTGGLREVMEALTWALSHGEGDLARRIVAMASELEGGGKAGETLEHVEAYFDRLRSQGEWDAFLQRAAANLTLEHVVFTGFMDHAPLSQLYAIADVGLFPSVVREASPLVVPEAAASGTLPIGTDYGGMGDSLRTLGASLPADAQRLLTVRMDPEHAVSDLVENTVAALQAGPGRWSDDLRRAAVERYDWQTIATNLADTLQSLRREPATR
jgi:glycosyltransferase involved in cell wall biosynthesis